MKKTITTIFLAALCISLFGQDKKAAKVFVERRADNVLKIGALEPLFSTYSLAYERFIDETELSIQGKASVAYRNIVLWDAVQPKYFGYSLELQARFYFIIYERQVPNGLYLGLFGKYSRKNATLKTASSEITFIDGFGKTIGLLTGWQHRFQKSMSRFVFDFNFGGGYQFADFSGRFSEKGKLISFLDSGIVPKIDFMVGFNF